MQTIKMYIFKILFIFYINDMLYVIHKECTTPMFG